MFSNACFPPWCPPTVTLNFINYRQIVYILRWVHFIRCFPHLKKVALFRGCICIRSKPDQRISFFVQGSPQIQEFCTLFPLRSECGSCAPIIHSSIFTLWALQQPFFYSKPAAVFSPTQLVSRWHFFSNSSLVNFKMFCFPIFFPDFDMRCYCDSPPIRFQAFVAWGAPMKALLWVSSFETYNFEHTPNMFAHKPVCFFCLHKISIGLRYLFLIRCSYLFAESTVSKAVIERNKFTQMRTEYGPRIKVSSLYVLFNCNARSATNVRVQERIRRSGSLLSFWFHFLFNSFVVFVFVLVIFLISNQVF